MPRWNNKYQSNGSQLSLFDSNHNEEKIAKEADTPVPTHEEVNEPVVPGGNQAFMREASELTIIRLLDPRPEDVPSDYLIFNAPRPLLGDKDWTGDFLHGIFYAAIDITSASADRTIQDIIDLDGWLCEYVTQADIEKWERERATVYDIRYEDHPYNVWEASWLQNKRIEKCNLNEYLSHQKQLPASQISEDSDSLGANLHRVPVVLAKAEIERLSGLYCAQQITEGKPVKKCYILGHAQPHVITGIVWGSEGATEIKAWRIVPLQEVGEENAIEYAQAARQSKEGFSYNGIKINCGSAKNPQWWVMVGQSVRFSREQDLTNVETKLIAETPEAAEFKPLEFEEPSKSLSGQPALDYRKTHSEEPAKGMQEQEEGIENFVHLPENAGPGRLFIGGVATGLSYCDRAQEEHGDYKKVANLFYDTLELKIYDHLSPLLPEIEAHAKKMQAMRGEWYPTAGSDSSGVILGNRSLGEPTKREPQITVDEQPVYRSSLEDETAKPGGRPEHELELTPGNVEMRRDPSPEVLENLQLLRKHQTGWQYKNHIAAERWVTAHSKADAIQQASNTYLKLPESLVEQLLDIAAEIGKVESVRQTEPEPSLISKVHTPIVIWHDLSEDAKRRAYRDAIIFDDMDAGIYVDFNNVTGPQHDWYKDGLWYRSTKLQPWEISQEQYVRAHVRKEGIHSEEMIFELYSSHRKLVEETTEQGINVSARALADYPELRQLLKADEPLSLSTGGAIALPQEQEDRYEEVSNISVPRKQQPELGGEQKNTDASDRVEEESQATQYSQVLRQYIEIKREHLGTLLFFKAGDFYALFYDDAVRCSIELDITLTACQNDRGEAIPMWSVPSQAADVHIANLINTGYRIAICEQTEDLTTTNNLVHYKVARVITPTSLERELLESAGLLREYRDRWQYKFFIDGRWTTANTEEDAVQKATETYLKLPESERITKAEREERAYRAILTNLVERYRTRSTEELENRLKKNQARQATLNKRQMDHGIHQYGTQRSASIIAELNGLATENDEIRAVLNARKGPEEVSARDSIKAGEPLSKNTTADVSLADTPAGIPTNTAIINGDQKGQESSRVLWSRVKEGDRKLELNLLNFSEFELYVIPDDAPVVNNAFFRTSQGYQARAIELPYPDAPKVGVIINITGDGAVHEILSPSEFERKTGRKWAGNREAQGKDIPAEVLTDYPNLTQQKPDKVVEDAQMGIRPYPTTSSNSSEMPDEGLSAARIKQQTEPQAYCVFWERKTPKPDYISKGLLGVTAHGWTREECEMSVAAMVATQGGEYSFRILTLQEGLGIKGQWRADQKSTEHNVNMLLGREEETTPAVSQAAQLADQKRETQASRSIENVKFTTGTRSEVLEAIPDRIFAISQGKTYFTLWTQVRRNDLGEYGRWTYLSILPRTEADAIQAAEQAMRDVASGKGKLQAFISGAKKDIDGKSFGLVTDRMAPEELIKSELVAIGDQMLGIGNKYPNVPIKDLFDKDADYAIWAADNLRWNQRARDISEYLQSRPEYMEAKNAAIEAAQAILDSDTMELLKEFGIEAKSFGSGITFGGKTYDYKGFISKAGGRFYGGVWHLTPAQAGDVIDELRGLPRAAGGQRGSIPDYFKNPKLAKLRRDIDARPDRSGLERAIGEYVGQDTQSLLKRGIAAGMPARVIDEQIEDVAKIRQAYERENGLFLLASEPGSGKTFVLGAAIRELRQAGSERIVYVTLRKELISQIKEDLKDYEIGDVRFITYPEMRTADVIESDVLIFDEAHSVKNVAVGDEGAQQAKSAAQWIRNTKMAIVSTATPFENPVQAEYLEPTRIFEAFGGFENFALAFGARKQNLGDEEILIWRRNPYSDEDAKAARDYFVKEGVFTSRPTRLPEGMVDTRMVKIAVHDESSKMYAALTESAVRNEGKLLGFGAAWVVNLQKRILEAAKVERGIQEARSAIERGRHAILFVETKAERNIDIPDLIRRENEWRRAVDAAMAAHEPAPRRSDYGLPPSGVVDTLADFMASTAQERIVIPSAEDVIKEALGPENVAIFTGSITPKKAQENLDAWRCGAKKVIVATIAKGGTGLSLHDKKGDHPNTQIVINLPWTATQVKQVAQRPARYGLQSKAEILWLFADNIPFDRMLAARVGGRMADLGASVYGDTIAEATKLENWDFESKAFSELKEELEGLLPPVAVKEIVQKTTVKQSDVDVMRMDVKKHYHTKMGQDIYIVTLSDRVDKAKFVELNTTAKNIGGWYSRAFRGSPAGFAFKNEAKAKLFISNCGGDVAQDMRSKQTEAATQDSGEGRLRTSVAPSDVVIGQRVQQIYRKEIGTVCQGSESGFTVIFDNGSASHHQRVGALSPITQINPVDPAIIESKERVQELIALNREYMETAKGQREEKMQQKQIDTERHILELRDQYPWAVSSDGMSTHARAAKNLRMELKRHCPGVNFSVTSSSYSGGNSIDVRWVLGPTTKEVEALANKYQDGHFDGMQDLHVHDSSAYGSAIGVVLGRVRSVYCQRDYSAEVREKIERGLCKLQGVDYNGPTTIVMNSGLAYRDQVDSQARTLLAETSFPVDFDGEISVTSKRDRNNYSGHWAEIVFSSQEGISTDASEKIAPAGPIVGPDLQARRLPPPLEHYLDIKNNYPETLLFFSVGDLYELYFDDAMIGSRELDITLTARHDERREPVPMCEVPYHAADVCIAKLANKGYRVAICEQVADPQSTIKSVRGEVVRVIAPAASERELLDNVEIAEIKERKRGQEEASGIPFTNQNGESQIQSSEKGAILPQQPNIPDFVQKQVIDAIESLRSINEEMERGRQLDNRFGGEGRWESDIYEAVQGGIQKCNEVIATFRKYAPLNNVDAEAFLQILGGVPEIMFSEKGQEWFDYQIQKQKKQEESENQSNEVGTKPETTSFTNDAQTESQAVGLPNELAARFSDAIIQAAQSEGELTQDQRQHIAHLSEEIVSLIRAQERKVDFWRFRGNSRELTSKIAAMLDGPPMVISLQRHMQVAGRLVQLAKAALPEGSTSNYGLRSEGDYVTEVTSTLETYIRASYESRIGKSYSMGAIISSHQRAKEGLNAQSAVYDLIDLYDNYPSRQESFRIFAQRRLGDDAAQVLFADMDRGRAYMPLESVTPLISWLPVRKDKAADQNNDKNLPVEEYAGRESERDERAIKSIRQGQIREPEGSESWAYGRGDEGDSVAGSGGSGRDVRQIGGVRGRPLGGERTDITRSESANADERREYVGENIRSQADITQSSEVPPEPQRPVGSLPDQESTNESLPRTISQPDPPDLPLTSDRTAMLIEAFSNSVVLKRNKTNLLTVYHGTDAQFEVFDASMLGSKGRAPSAYLGFAFTSDESAAREYGQKILRAHLNITNPYFMEWEEIEPFESVAKDDPRISELIEEAKSLRERLEMEGYDGIEIEDLDTWIAFHTDQIWLQYKQELRPEEYVDETDPSRTKTQRPSAARKPDNYHITDLDSVAHKGKKAKLDANLAAIRLLRELQAEERTPTKEEQDVLGHFVGWGQFPELFNEINDAGQKVGKEREELKSLLGEQEYERARRSVLNAHYTDPHIIDKIWEIVSRMGFKGGRVLEPSMGVGYFYGLMPRELMAQSKLAGVEIEPTTGAIARMLYPNASINVKGFQEVRIADGFYDLVIGNVPFGDFRVHDPDYNKYRANIHDYFFLKTLDKTRAGGIVVLITSTGTLDKADSQIRREIAKRGDLIAAMRFPENAFEKNAGTSVVTDLLIFRRWAEGEHASTDKTSGDYFPALSHLEGEEWNHSAIQRLDAQGRPIVNMAMEAEIDQIQYQFEWKGKEQPPDADIRALRELGLRQESRNVWVTPLVKHGPSSDWTRLGELPDPDGVDPIPINNYFVRNPEMILGRLDRKSRMYRSGEPHVSATGDFVERFDKAIASLPANIYNESRTRATEPEAVADAVREKVIEGGYILREDRVLQRQGDVFVVPNFTPAEETKAKRLIAVRDALNALNAAQLKGEGTAESRQALNNAYDHFVLWHGPIRKATNAKLLAEDPSSYLLLALETSYDTKRQKAKKADIFTKDTVARARGAMDVTTPAAAIAVNLFEMGRVDVNRIAELLKTTTEDAAKRMVADGLAYENPRGTWEKAEEYLSGNVRKKLIEAREAAEVDSKYAPNIEALEKVQPADIRVDQISVKLGASWIPAQDIKNFAGYLMQTDPSKFHIRYTERLGIWTVSWGSANLSQSSLAREVYGTARADFVHVLEAALNDRPIRLYDRNEGFDKEASEAANEKVKEVCEKFDDWLWTDDERSTRLHRYYNDNFNNLRVIERTYTHYANEEGRYVLPGMNPSMSLRPNQVKCIWQAVTNGRLLDASEVGSGKTFTLGAIAMEWRRLGLFHKPAIAVPKPRISATVAEIQLLYPAARILSLEKSFDSENRKRTTAQMATGDYDIIVLSHEQLDKMSMSPDIIREFIGAEIAEIEYHIKDAKGGSEGNRIVKRLEKIKERVEVKLQDALDGTKKDNIVHFEQSGIDALLVDEAHAFKSLPVYSRRSDVKGIPTTRSDRATNMYMRVRWLMGQNNNKGVVFATGTPITNTIAEAYNLQRYIQPDLLEERGISNFDAWANLFATIATDFEYKASGTFEPVSRFTEFVNLPELQQMLRQDMATNFVDEMPWIVRPKKVENVITSPMTQDQVDYLQKIRERVDNLKSMSPQERRESWDNYLLISTDARKSALSPRLVSSRATESGGKIEKVVEKTLELHRARPDVTQMIFLDFGVHPNHWNYAVYDDIQERLVANGIPKERIANFGRMSDGARQKAAEKLNKGEYLIAIGSSGKMGTGINAQERLAAMHHVDFPWLPALLEQRNGRGHRQGNKNDPTKPPEAQIVEVNYYPTELSFDVVMLQALKRKSEFIVSFMRGDMSVREMRMDDTGDEATGELGPEMILAAASGNPYELDRIRLIKDIQRLERQARTHRQQQSRYRTRIAEGGRDRAKLMQDIEMYGKDQAQYESTKGQEFSVTFNGKTYGDRKVAGNHLAIAVVELHELGNVKIGQYRGFDLFIWKGDDTSFHTYLLGGDKGKRTRYDFDLQLSAPEGAFNSADANLRIYPSSNKARVEERLAALERDIETAKVEVDKPFRRAEELEQKRQKLRDITTKIEEEYDQKPGRDVRRLARRLESLTGNVYGIKEVRKSMADVVQYNAAFDRWLLALKNVGIVSFVEANDTEGEPEQYIRDSQNGRFYSALAMERGWEKKAASVPPISVFIEAEAQSIGQTLTEQLQSMDAHTTDELQAGIPEANNGNRTTAQTEDPVAEEQKPESVTQRPSILARIQRDVQTPSSNQDSDRSTYWGTPQLPRGKDGRPRELTEAEKSEFIGHSRAEYRNNRIWVNEQGAMTYAVVLKKVFPDSTHPVEVDGLTVPLEDARPAVEYLRKRAEKASTDVFRQVFTNIADQLELGIDAADSNGDEAITIVSTDARNTQGRRSLREVIITIREEDTHKKMGVGLFPDDVITTDPDYEQHRAALATYDRHPKEYLTPQNVFADTLARVVTGRWAELGYKSETDALEYLARVFERVYTDYGAEALHRLPAWTTATKGVRENVINRRTGVSEGLGALKGEITGGEITGARTNLRERGGAGRRSDESLRSEVPGVESGAGRDDRGARTREDIENSAEFKQWFGTSVVTETGKPGGIPLVVYHGTATAKSFDVFEAHTPQDVYELNGKEIIRADSWDMGELREEMPEAYHYLALSWSLILGPEKALAQAISDVERLSSNISPDTTRFISDLKRLCGKHLTHRVGIRPTDNAFFFTPDTEYSFIRDIGKHECGRVLPVYLSIKNPIYLNTSEIEGAGYSYQVERYKREGYDGAIYAEDINNLRKRGWNGCTQIVAFYPEQIKSAIGNCGMFEVGNPSILAKIRHNGASSPSHQSDQTVKQSVPFITDACANGAEVAQVAPCIKGSDLSVISFKNVDGTYVIKGNDVFVTEKEFQGVLTAIKAAPGCMDSIDDLKLVIGNLQLAHLVEIYTAAAKVEGNKTEYMTTQELHARSFEHSLSI
jgi:N12 class adenine-specific DNA methylase